MKRISRHKVLVAGESFDHCSIQVNRFFDLTSLVIYDCIEIPEEQASSGVDSDFFRKIRAAEKRNHLMVCELVADLKKSGIQSISDMHKIEQGYVSKTLHVLSHFLDGFIGIDSYFYNLLDDSHWLPDSTANLIKQNPGQYWLLHLDCYSLTPEEAGILHL